MQTLHEPEVSHVSHPSKQGTQFSELDGRYYVLLHLTVHFLIPLISINSYPSEH